MLRVLLPFFAGVATGFQLSSKIQIWWVIFLSFLIWVVVFTVFRWQMRKPAASPWLVSPLLCLLFFILGVGTGIHTRPLDPGLPVDQWVLVRGELTDMPHPGSYAYAFDLEVHLLSWADTICLTNTHLKCYMSMPADSLLPAPGEIWQFSGKLASIRNSGNPGSPDYRSIMGRKNFWYRFYVSSGTLAIHFNREVAESERRLDPVLLRRKVSDHWHGDREEVSLLKAVCLGDRSSLTDDMRQAYAAAGGMHLLAVSGLHVGLIWWVLQYMTGWMRIIFRKGKQRTVLVVGFLWFYAFLTGFSSSVCRSVTMFSFFSVSRIMGERVQPLNVILASAFLLVLIEPLRLMDVGFQLSYAAIIGIVSLHPPVVRLLRVKNRVLRWVWEATSVSLAAQLSTAPLVIYYFHQLPVFSLITNLIAVPLLSLLIAIFVCSVPFISMGILEKLSSFLLVELARLMNLSMEHLSSMPGAVLDGLHLNRLSLLIWILMLLLGMIALYGRRRIPYLLLFLVSVLLIGNSFSALKRRSSSELIIAHFKGASMVTIREGIRVDHYCWYRDSASVEYMKAYRELTWSRRTYENRLYEAGDDVRDGVRITGTASTCVKLAEGAWLLGGNHFSGLVLTAPVNADVWIQACRSDFIVLSGEPEMDGMKNNDLIQQAALVIDGSNRSWYKERMLAECDQIYLTDQSGAYVKRW